MEKQFIDPFVQSIQDIFSMMLGISVRLDDPKPKDRNEPMFEISSIIGLSGNVTGSVVISMPEDTAKHIAGALSGETIESVDDECTDALGEIANMIAGGAKKDLPGEDNSISIPSVVIGRHKVVYPKDIPIITIPCQTEHGSLMVDVSLKEMNVPAGSTN